MWPRACGTVALRGWHTVGRGPWGVGVAQARGAGGGGGRAHAYGFTALPPTTVAPETSSVSAALGAAPLVPQDRTPEAPAQDRHRHRGARTRVSIRHILYLYREFLLTAFIMWLPKWQVRSLSVRNRKHVKRIYIRAYSHSRVPQTGALAICCPKTHGAKANAAYAPRTPMHTQRPRRKKESKPHPPRVVCSGGPRTRVSTHFFAGLSLKPILSKTVTLVSAYFSLSRASSMVYVSKSPVRLCTSADCW